MQIKGSNYTLFGTHHRHNPLARNELREPWRIPAMRSCGWSPLPFGTTGEHPLPNERKRCDYNALPGFGST
jgi:hypothetical protein